MSRAMTDAEVEQVREVIASIDDAWRWIEADLRRLQKQLAAGIELPTIGAINRAIWLAKGERA